MAHLVEYNNERVRFIMEIGGQFYAVPMAETGRSMTSVVKRFATINTVWAGVDPIWDGAKTKAEVRGSLELWIPGFPYETFVASFPS